MAGPKIAGFNEICDIVDALGIIGGVRRLVIECDIGKPITVYFSRYIEKCQAEALVDCLKKIRDTDPASINVIECVSVTVGNDGAIIAVPKTEV